MQKLSHFYTLILLSIVAAESANGATENLFDLSLEQLVQIKITSEKREQQWDEVAQTVDVYTGVQLRNSNINDMLGLSEIASGFSFGRVGNVANIYVRGIGSDLLSIASDASTAVYLDDVYLARSEMTLAHFWDVERIEVLKGPQGALYGRNATGGAIKIVPKHANFDSLAGYAQLNIGSFNARKLEAAIGGAISETFAARTSLLIIKDDGFTQDLNPQGANTIDNQNLAAGRLELLWKPNEQLESSLTADHYQNNNDGFSIRPNDNYGIAEQQGASATDFHQTRNNIPSYNDYETQGLNWRWSWNADSWNLQTISAYRTITTGYRFNTDGTEIPVTESRFDVKQNQRSHELRLASNNVGAWQWLAGISWLKETPELNVGLTRFPLNTSTVILADAETTAWGSYGEIGWTFHPQWNATLRLRNSFERRDDSNKIFSTGDLLGLDSPVVDAPRNLSAKRNSSFQKLSPQFKLSYSPISITGNKLWFLNATEGFKSGGANSLSIRPSFKPEEIMSYETGYKSSSDTGQWSLTAFHYDYRNLQVVSFEKGFTTVANAATATIDGIDVSSVFNLGDHLQYQTGISYLNAHYDHFITSVAGAPKDVSGNSMPYAPEWDINQKLSYQYPLQQGKLTVQLLHHFQAKTYFNQFEDAAVSSQNRNTFDLLANWEVNREWSLNAGVFNLTDARYFQNILRFTTTSIASAPQGNALGYTAPGRRWAMGAKWQF
jgi:iron complex outermembrane recepter protein